MVIWYIYEKPTGVFAGSGATFFDDEQYGSTEIPVPDYDFDTQNAYFRGDHWEIVNL